MSADEVRRYGTKFINHPYICAFTMWTSAYDYGARLQDLNYRYFRRSDIQQAVGELSWAASQRAAGSCVR